MKLIHAIWNLIFPPKCILCRRVLKAEETDLCHSCRKEIGEHPDSTVKLPYLAKWLALWYYEGNVRLSLLRFKFHNARSYADVYGRFLAMKLMREHIEFDLISWIPISAIRKWFRGYDQVKLITDAVAKELSLTPVVTLKKIRHNPPQSGFGDASHRRANVLGVYEAVDPEQFAGKRVLILDDILTTGATAGEAARVLLTAGAKEVYCAAVAAAPHKPNKQ